jgi:hypothetical protein
VKKNLGISLVIAALAALFASQSPDGLDKVAQVLGFNHQGVEHNALLTGYRLPFLHDAKLSTLIAGAAGVLMTYGLFLFIAFALRRKGASQPGLDRRKTLQ